MNKNSLLTENYYNKFKSLYNIIGHLHFKEFDHDFHILADYLESINNRKFDINDRFIVEHIDTDFYMTNNNTIGINLYNLIEAFLKTDVPIYTLLIYTNHFGIKDEVIKILGNAYDKNNFPTIIETFIASAHYPKSFESDGINNDNISKHAICMMKGTPRSHRLAFYNKVVELDMLDKIAISVNGLK